MEAFLWICVAILLIVAIVFIYKWQYAEKQLQDYKYWKESRKNIYSEVASLREEIKDKNLTIDDLNDKIKSLITERAELKNQVDKLTVQQEICKDNNESLLHISNLVIERTQKLKDIEKRYEEVKTNVNEKTQILNDLDIQIQNAIYALEQKQAAWSAVDSFEKCGFGNELPYIDYEEYFAKNNFEIVLKLLDDCIDVAPQFKSELRKIEWNLCYLPYKKNFIKDFSRSGIYMLEVKNKYENEVLMELGLKRINDSGSIVYIGQAVNIYERWTTHIKKMLGIETSGGEKLYKFKPLMFKWKVIEWCDSSELNEREKFWIDSFKSDEFGLNSKGGNR